jgi:hypothetical protein
LNSRSDFSVGIKAKAPPPLVLRSDGAKLRIAGELRHGHFVETQYLGFNYHNMLRFVHSFDVVRGTAALIAPRLKA